MLYFLDKKDWSNFGRFYAQYVSTAKGHGEYPLSNTSYVVLEHVSDTAVLQVAIEANQPVADTSGKDDPIGIDLYSNLLYKAGRRQDALEWEEKALRLSGGQDADITEHLKKMKAGEPTWDAG